MMRTTELLCCTLIVLLVTGCATPKRGGPEFAPAMPQQVQAPEQHSDAIYQPATSLLLFEDIKARRVGDMITVTLREQTDAAKSADTGTTKSSNTSFMSTKNEVALNLPFVNSKDEDRNMSFDSSTAARYLSLSRE